MRSQNRPSEQPESCSWSPGCGRYATHQVGLVRPGEPVDEAAIQHVCDEHLETWTDLNFLTGIDRSAQNSGRDASFVAVRRFRGAR